MLDLFVFLKQLRRSCCHGTFQRFCLHHSSRTSQRAWT